MYFSFSLRDLPLVYIMHVMQLLPGYQIYMNYLHKLFKECEQLIVANQEQRFRSIVLDVCCKILFFPVHTGTNSTAKPLRRFIKVFFRNKGIDKVKRRAILHNKLVRSKAPIYCQEQDPPLVSYKYRSIIIIFLGVCSAIIRPFAILISMIIVMRPRRVTANLQLFLMSLTVMSLPEIYE